MPVDGSRGTRNKLKLVLCVLNLTYKRKKKQDLKKVRSKRDRVKKREKTDKRKAV